MIVSRSDVAHILKVHLQYVSFPLLKHTLAYVLILVILASFNLTVPLVFSFSHFDQYVTAGSTPH